MNNVSRHVEAFHSGLQFKCRECEHFTTTLQNLRAHRKKVRLSLTAILVRVLKYICTYPNILVGSAHGNILTDYAIVIRPAPLLFR